MTLYEKWNWQFSRENAQGGEAFITQYYQKEKKAYASILAGKNPEIETTVADFAVKYGMEEFEVTGFAEGIRTSLNNEADVDPEKLESESPLKMSINWEKLYINMHKAKAHWLFNLPEWDGIYSEDERAAIMRNYHKSIQAVSEKVGRNSPCPCGSGKKYKNCCGAGK